jgi:nitric oxide reductase NorD protein
VLRTEPPSALASRLAPLACASATVYKHGCLLYNRQPQTFFGLIVASTPYHPSDALFDRLAGALERSTASAMADDLARIAESNSGSDLLALFDELRALSQKISNQSIEVLPELQRRGVLAEVFPWLDLGVALAEASGAAAIKYFKESPLILGLIESGPRRIVLAVALELAESDPNVALDFLRKAPELLTVLPPSKLAEWAAVGLDLARVDYVLGIEFFRQSPSVARVIPLDLVRDWVAFGSKLITQNSLGKPDYVGTLEFFRTSPALFGDIEGESARKGMIMLGASLAARDPTLAISFLAESPSILRRLPSEEWRTRVLQYGLLVAERDAESALAYLRRCPEIVVWLGNSLEDRSKFEDWFKGGMDILAYSIEGARAYFALETKKALASVEQAMGGVPLRQVARSLKLFAQGLCGTDIMIQSLPAPEGESAGMSVRAHVSPDGRTIGLPAIVRQFLTQEENTRLYTVMTAHEAGHLEFGTYQVPLTDLNDLVTEVGRRYRRECIPSMRTLSDLFALYPQPGLIRDLWTVLEDARVEYRLQQEYPGLQRDLVKLARDAVKTRSLLHGLSAREMVVDCLLMLSTAEPGTVRIPDGIADVVQRVWALSQTILTPVASAVDAIRVADRIYIVLDEMIATADREPGTGEREPEPDVGPGPKASETTSRVYRPVTNWSYRGDMNPEQVRDREEVGSDSQAANPGEAVDQPPSVVNESAPWRDLASDRSPQVPGKRQGSPIGEHWVSGSTAPSLIEEMLAVGHEPREDETALSRSGSTFFYDEWDGLIRDYRSRWCRVVELVAPEGDTSFAHATLAEHGSSVRLLRRYFESIRPPGLRRVSGQTDGEDIDLDAAIGRTVDRLAGVEPTDRVYARREKKERDVAVAFLVDLSGSTSRQIEQGRRIIEIEKEGLVLLTEALDAVGDQYAIYGYSGQGRGQVDFVIMKDFDEPSRRASARVGGIVPLHQNRDGAAIRHAGRKLLGRDARVRLLVLISDGKPLDDAYADEYALEDTKMALREVQRQGVDSFCITVDRHADDYLRRMYGDVRFLVIDHVEALPERLPKIYHRLTT